ncbi:NrsF family protein [Bradyrhizobium sp. GCM10028915]|uniref:NrsF family protein n=1 Tax=Bradyrhizobium sp. GCM10028915 TaxID=3273385 RepID=UPI0036211BB4
MRTEDLIDALARSARPVDRTMVGRRFTAALLMGGAFAVCIAIASLGMRPDLAASPAVGFVAAKLVFAAAIFVVAAFYLIRVARPGGEARVSFLAISAPFVASVAIAAAVLAGAPAAHWDRMLLGDEWAECLLSIPLIAIVPFALVIWATRRAAPTDLVRAGAFAGLVAGSISAMAYALHCTDDSLPFVTVWYGGTIAVCTLAGALLGPRLLRW